MDDLQTTLSLVVAFILGAAIGLEREWRQRTAGLRTNLLVAVGAAAFANFGMRIAGADGATKVVPYIVSGIGFLGAGVIMKDGMSIRGLNTAATLWCSAAVGAFAGSGLPLAAAIISLFVLAGNTLPRPLINWINRRPITEDTTEALYRVLAVCDHENVSDVRDLLDDTLAAANYPIREIVVASDNEEQVELAAVLASSAAQPEELETVVEALETSPLVRSATWTAGASG